MCFTFYIAGKSESDEKFAKQFKAFTLRAHQTPDYIERKRRKSQPYVSTSAGGNYCLDMLKPYRGKSTI